MSTWRYCSGVLCGKSKFLLSLLKHLPAEYSVSKAIDFVLFLIAQTARGLDKNRGHSLVLAFSTERIFACAILEFIVGRRKGIVSFNDSCYNSLIFS